MGEKHLPMLTVIHGGPADANGDSFEADWYDWANLAAANDQSEAALFQMNKVTTPTHIVGGNADVRVSYLEDVLLERALQQLRVPHSLLVFPGEGHSLDKNPWHGYIKVREELQWLEKYGNGKTR